jgi:SAM-dependent methyltransferase
MAEQDDVLAYYGGDVEADRLDAGAGAIEFERTKEILLRYLEPRSTIADVGGAVGRYAEWLVEREHSVELLDPVPSHVDVARERAGDPRRFGVHLGDARSLPFENGSFDAVLLFGPLYHLGDAEDRARAIDEAVRVCRPGGLVFAAAISRLAPLLGNIRGGRFDEDLTNALEETATGRRVAADRRRAPFPDAYFHLPRELEDELTSAGLSTEGVYGVEGPGWLVVGPRDTLVDGQLKEQILEAARACERDQQLAAVSAHLLAVARKPG